MRGQWWRTFPRLRLASGTVACSTGILREQQDFGKDTTVRDADVVVLGAGMSGAAAARELRQQGYCPMVLEARGRIGGRAFSADWDGTTVELGGHYVHPCQPFIFTELRRYQIPMIEANGVEQDAPAIWEVKPGDWRSGTQQEVDAISAKVCEELFKPGVELLERPFEPEFWEASQVTELDRLSLQERLDQIKSWTDEERALAVAWWEGCTNCSADRAGFLPAMKWFACPGWNFQRMLDATGRYLIEGGSGRLVSAMLDDARADVRLETQVTAVEEVGSRIVVTTDDGQRIAAEAVVVALPLNVLHTVKFSPPLSEVKQKTAGEGHAAEGIQVMIKVKGKGLKRFMGMSPGRTADGRLGFHWLTTESFTDDSAVLVAYGPSAADFDVHDPKRVAEEVARWPLGDIAVTDHFAWNWVGDEFARGTWCMLRPGQMSQLPELQRPEGRVFFAGDYLGRGWNGFMDGAIESGIRTGRDVAKYLNRSPQQM